MKQIDLSPREYHRMAFRKSKLPDLKTAGPVSASILKKVKNPVHWLTVPEKENKDAFRWGSMIDCMWITPQLWKDEFVIIPKGAPRDLRFHRDAKKPSADTARAIKWWDAFSAEAGEREPVWPSEVLAVQHVVKNLENHPIASAIHADSKKQVVLLGQCPFFDKADSKAMLDLLPVQGPFADAIVDLKTTKDASDSGFLKEVHQYQYILQLAYYGILSEAAGFGPRNRGVLIYQNNREPYDVHTVEFGSKTMALGKQLCYHRMEVLSGLSMEDAPYYSDNRQRIVELDNWMLREMEAEITLP